MSLTTRLLLIGSLTSFAFWIPIWLPFAQNIGIETSSAYGIIAFYSILVVILEYPTGVIGDTYSHKSSTVLGFISLIIASIVMAFASNAFSLISGIALFALGTSLISGSDQAYYKSLLGEKFREFYPSFKNVCVVSTLVGVTLGTVLYSWHYMAPLLLNAAFFLVATLLLLSLPREERLKDPIIENANPFTIAKKGLAVFFTSLSLRNLLIVYAVIFALSNNLKWLYGNILDLVNLPVTFWGIIIAFFYLGRVVGVQFQNRVKGKKAIIALTIALANLMFLLGFVYSPLLIILVVFLVMVIIGAVETDLELDIQENSPNEVRSSILSLKSLLGRGSAAVYISLAGILTSQESITKLTLATFAFILFAVGVQISQYLKEKEAKL